MIEYKMNLKQLYTILASVMVLWLILGCSNPESPDDDGIVVPIDSPALPDRGFFMGILPIPGDYHDLAVAYSLASETVEFAPVWPANVGASAFWDFPDMLAGATGEICIDGLIRNNEIFPLIQFSFIDKDTLTDELLIKAPDNMPDASLADSNWRELYKHSILDAVRAARPKYISLGNEVNRWYEQYGYGTDNPNDFGNYISLYEDIYDSVKVLSPEVVTFCTFSREIVDELRQADMNVIDLFDQSKLDILMLTSYPYSVRKDDTGNPLEHPFNRPADIPDDYYSSVSAHLPGTPFGFSEITWTSAEFYGGEQGQADFLSELTTRLTEGQRLNLYMLGWNWLHDLNAADSTGLIARDGTWKQAYRTWQEISAGND
jgi:hypothetical protein